MTVAEVWGRVQGSDVLPLSHDGDDWLFPAPPGMSGTLICEFWAEDDAGNVGYRAAIITLDRGVIKCWRWLDIGCECIMRAQNRQGMLIAYNNSLRVHHARAEPPRRRDDGPRRILHDAHARERRGRHGTARLRPPSARLPSGR